MRNLYPDIYADSVSDITASMLKKMGMEAVVLDIDNTLVPHNDPNPTKSVYDFLSAMREAGIKICVISNNTKERVEPFCRRAKIEYFVCDALKPKGAGYVKAAKDMGLEPEKTAAIGDQIFTDIWGGNRAGCFTILVKPITFEGENLFIKFKRLLEKPIIRRIKRGKRT